jgi:exodeoxyribonuclease VII large subunit
MPEQQTSQALSVSQLVQTLKQLIETRLPLVWVEGEISNLSRPASGHLYFTLKDAGAQVRCAMFRPRAALLRMRPQDGMQVMLRARITLYEARGDLQLVVEHMEDAGFGALQRAFELLKQRLAAEGLFDAAHKRALPALPRRIGIITSPTGAAVRDVLHVLARRFPLIPLRIYSSSVQGAAAAGELVDALHVANAVADCDVLLLVRGGGSLEDLQAFNDETLARAIRASAIPVISGVGHETDFSIADFVADLRAPTPSAAAEMVVPDAQTLIDQITQHANRIYRRMRDRLETRALHIDTLARHLKAGHPRTRLVRMGERLQALTTRLLAAQQHKAKQRVYCIDGLQHRLLRRHPDQKIQLTQTGLLALSERMRHRAEQRLSLSQATLGQLSGRLHILSPLATLERGYAILEDSQGHAITQAHSLHEQQQIRARLRDAVLDCSILGIQPNSAHEQRASASRKQAVKLTENPVEACPETQKGQKALF